MELFATRKVSEAQRIRAEISDLEAQLGVLKSEERLSKHPEFDTYFSEIGRLIDAKVRRLVSLEPAEDTPLERLHYETDKLRHEIQILKLVAEAPKRAAVEVPQIEATIAELDERAAAIEQTWGRLEQKGMPNGGQER